MHAASQVTLNCSKSIIETLVKGVKSVPMVEFEQVNDSWVFNFSIDIINTDRW